MDGNISNDAPHPVTMKTAQNEIYNPPSSSDFNDPPMSVVLAWHIRNCLYCRLASEARPQIFGVPATQFCHEYWDIVQEYSDYEKYYASRGKP